jgi:DNA-binding YbaB/EbfC family protein
VNAVQPGGPFDFQQLLSQALTAQQELAAAEVTGQAGGGLVSITMTGEGAVTAVKIDPKVVDPDDVETLQDLVIGAFEDANRARQQLAMEKIGPLAGGLGGPGGLGGLGPGGPGLGGPGGLDALDGPGGVSRPD